MFQNIKTRTTDSDLKPSSMKRTTTYGVRNPGSVLWQGHKCSVSCSTFGQFGFRQYTICMKILLASYLGSNVIELLQSSSISNLQYKSNNM